MIKCRKAHSSRVCRLSVGELIPTPTWRFQFSFFFLIIFHFLWKCTSKPPYVGIFNLAKNDNFFDNFSDFVTIYVKTPIGTSFKFSKKWPFFFAFYQYFIILNFEKKIYKKSIDKNSRFTIDNVNLTFFNEKKLILSKKSLFRLIMTPNILHLKIMFYIEKTVSKKFWRSRKSFPSNVKPLWNRHSLSWCWENVKKCQNFTYGYFDKNSKNMIINRETVFRKTALSIGKSPKICRSFKG